MFGLYVIAREEGKYRALGGHRARTGTGDPFHCSVCGRWVTDTNAGTRHTPRNRMPAYLRGTPFDRSSR